MSEDMTVHIGEGVINIRVGAIIMKGNKILMAGTKKRTDYLFSVGGRLKFGETAEEAIIREVYEETGKHLEIDHLGFIQQNYFYGDAAINKGQLVYELCFFFYMKTPEDFEPAAMTFAEGDHEEFLRWIEPDEDIKYFPEFFREELKHPQKDVKYILIDNR